MSANKRALTNRALSQKSAKSKTALDNWALRPNERLDKTAPIHKVALLRCCRPHLPNLVSCALVLIVDSLNQDSIYVLALVWCKTWLETCQSKVFDFQLPMDSLSHGNVLWWALTTWTLLSFDQTLITVELQRWSRALHPFFMTWPEPKF